LGLLMPVACIVGTMLAGKVQRVDLRN
jgi:hypothetical protein